MAQRTWTNKHRQKRKREDQDRHEERREKRRAELLGQTVSRIGLEEAEELSDRSLSRSRRVKDGQRAESGAELVSGRVVQYRRSSFDVQVENGQVFAVCSRSTTKSPHADSTLVAVGDQVLIDPEREVIVEVLPRKNRVGRASKLHADIEQVLVSNVDQLLVVASVRDPYLKPGVLDRYLLTAEAHQIQAGILLNKVDLDPDGEWREIAEIYREIGYPVLETSASSAAGLQELRALIEGRVSVFSGQSGVGKSSLLNALDPELELPVAEVMKGARKGRHTTTHSRLIPFSFGGWVADTPGIKEFRLFGLGAEEIASLYPEYRFLSPKCRFNNCTHTHEPECAVKEALEEDELSWLRYKNYLQVLEQLQES